jgi:CRISPR type IV-associated protein Csf2
MESYLFEGVMTALSSISHNGGQSFGINSKLRREKLVQTDGTVEEVPLLSGNGMRGMLRDRGMFHMCKALGYGVNEQTGEVHGLSLPAFYFLFSGGALTSTGGRGLDIDLARRLRTLIPLVSVFGGAVGNQIMPGKLKVGKAMPICAETLHLLPDKYTGPGVQSIWEYLQEEMYTRKDDEKNEHLRVLMAPDVLQLMDGKHQAEKVRREEGGAETETGEHQQMRYFVETFAAGTRFYWYLVLDDASLIEFEALVTTLVEFSKLPYVGGKSATGFGKVSISFDGWMKIQPNIQMDGGTALDTPIGTHYSAHLREHAAAIRDELARMA